MCGMLPSEVCKLVKLVAACCTSVQPHTLALQPQQTLQSCGNCGKVVQRAFVWRVDRSKGPPLVYAWGLGVVAWEPS